MARRRDAKEEERAASLKEAQATIEEADKVDSQKVVSIESLKLASLTACHLLETVTLSVVLFQRWWLQRWNNLRG